MFLDEYQDIPYKVLKYTAGEINYGGHVTDDWDRRCLLSVLEDFYCPAVLSSDHVYSASGVYQQIDTKLDIKIVKEIVAGIVEKIPPPFDIEEVMEKYPVLYEESMNTVLIQEVIR
ncbi:unnamed protein product [Oreochromis niloticus]|nr:unnamed protein product [Mustela putorius furo]